MRTFAIFTILAVAIAAVYGAAIDAEKPVEAQVTPIRGQEAAPAAPKEDLKGAESAYAVLPYAGLPYATYPYYRYSSYPYAHYPYVVPSAYYVR